MAALMNSNTPFHPRAAGKYMTLCNVPEKCSYRCRLLLPSEWGFLTLDLCLDLIVQSEVLLPWSVNHFTSVCKTHFIKLKAAHPPFHFFLQCQCRQCSSDIYPRWLLVLVWCFIYSQFSLLMFGSFHSDASLCWPSTNNDEPSPRRDLNSIFSLLICFPSLAFI